MKIVICGSIDFTHKIKEVADLLLERGHQIEVPLTVKKILDGEIAMEKFLTIKRKDGDLYFRQNAKEDLIKRYFRLIKDSDAILVVNINKKGIENYIGGNTFLEMGFAYILDKKIYLLNDIPTISYKDEIVAMQPTVLSGDLDRIKKDII